MLSYSVATAASASVCMCHSPSGGGGWGGGSARLSHCCSHVCYLETLLLLTRSALTHGSLCRRPDCITAQSAPDTWYCRESSSAQLVSGCQHAPWMNCAHWPRCPVATPPINHYLLTAPAMVSALRKFLSPLSSLQDDG